MGPLRKYLAFRILIKAQQVVLHFEVFSFKLISEIHTLFVRDIAAMSRSSSNPHVHFLGKSAASTRELHRSETTLTLSKWAKPGVNFASTVEQDKGWEVKVRGVKVRITLALSRASTTLTPVDHRCSQSDSNLQPRDQQNCFLGVN